MGPKILILGGSGFIGSAFARELASRSLDFGSISRSQCDYTLFENIYSLLKKGKPELVINCSGVAGVPSVDWCETHRGETIKGNLLAAAAISDACFATGTLLGHVSTGCVYSGPRPMDAPWTELDAPNFSFDSSPCSFYSGTKELAEWKVAGNPLAWIWRLRMPFCEEAHPKNLISKFLKYPAIYDSPKNSLSHLGDCVRACVDCWQNGLRRGIYNVVSPGALTNREIVGFIRAILKPDRTYDAWQKETEFYSEPGRTPRSNCVLSVKKLLDAGVKLRPVQEALRETLEHYRP